MISAKILAQSLFFKMIFPKLNIKDLPSPNAMHDEIKQLRARFNEPICMAPTNDCEGGIIKAHTLSVGQMLTPISRDGHVYSLKINVYNATKTDTAAQISLRGIREISVFRGFCAKHDRELFLPIENRVFTASAEQIFLHAFRAIAKECYLKPKGTIQAKRIPELRKNIYNQKYTYITGEEQQYITGSEYGAKDMFLLKKKMDKLMIRKDFSKLRTVFVSFKRMPDIVCNFVYTPDMDFDDKELQDFNAPSGKMEHLFVTVSPHTNGGGYLLLSHLGNRKASNSCRRLIESLLTQPDISSAIARLVFSRTENYAISPTWFDSLSPQRKKQIQDAFEIGTILNPCCTLKNIGIQVPDWEPQKPVYR